MAKLSALQLAMQLIHEVHYALPIGACNLVPKNEWASAAIKNTVRAKGSSYWSKQGSHWLFQRAEDEEYTLPKSITGMDDAHVRLINTAVKTSAAKAGNCSEMAKLALIKACAYNDEKNTFQHFSPTDDFSFAIISGRVKYKQGIDHYLLVITLNGVRVICDPWLNYACEINDDTLKELHARLEKAGLLAGVDASYWTSLRQVLKDDLTTPLTRYAVTGHKEGKQLAQVYEQHQQFFQKISSSLQAKIEHFRAGVLQGNALAEYSLGRAYEKGLGVPQCYNTASILYLSAAGHKNADAAYRLGRMYEIGRGVAIDYDKAVTWYLEAAQHQYPNSLAQYSLARIYEKGIGFQQSFAQAIQWYEMAAKGKLSDAHYRLGNMHEKGLGVPINEDKAIEYYIAAASLDHSEAAYRMGHIYEKKIVDMKYPDSAIIDAIKWYLKSAGLGNKNAQHRIERMYQKGLFTSVWDKLNSNKKLLIHKWMSRKDNTKVERSVNNDTLKKSLCS